MEAGQRTDLEVYVSTINGDNPTITWFQGNQMITSNSRRLTFENVQLSDAGVYNITASILGIGFVVLTNEAFITLTVYGECLIINTQHCVMPSYKLYDKLNNSRTQDI